MKFLQILGLASLAVAIPAQSFADSDASVLVKRGAIDTLFTSALASLVNTTTADLANINSTLATIKGSIDAQVTVILKADFDAILGALKNFTLAVIPTTLGGLLGVIGQLEGLTQSELTQIVSGVGTLLTLLANVRASLTLAINNLDTVVTTGIGGEIAAIRSAVAGLLSPIVTLIAGLKTVSVTGGLKVQGIPQLVNGVVTLLTSLLTSL